MGNCQAIDAATLVIQHPCGKEDRLYWAVTASEIMKMNPGHYVALLITTSLRPSSAHYNHSNDGNNSGGGVRSGGGGGGGDSSSSDNNNLVRVTRVKILRPTDTLVLGQVYRLITAQEVMKGLWARKQAKMRKNKSEPAETVGRVKEKSGSGFESAARRSELDKTNQVTKHERDRPRTTTSTTNSTTARGRTWQPSLQSISEAGS